MWLTPLVGGVCKRCDFHKNKPTEGRFIFGEIAAFVRTQRSGVRVTHHRMNELCIVAVANAKAIDTRNLNTETAHFCLSITLNNSRIVQIFKNISRRKQEEKEARAPAKN